MEFPIEFILSGRKRISGTKYFQNTKTQERQWIRKKYISRMDQLRNETKFLEDEAVCDFFSTQEQSKIQNRCYTYQTYRKMAEEVVKPYTAKEKKARELNKQRRMQRQGRFARKRALLEPVD